MSLYLVSESVNMSCVSLYYFTCIQNQSEHVMCPCIQNQSEHVMCIFSWYQNQSEHIVCLSICFQNQSEHVMCLFTCFQNLSEHVMCLFTCFQNQSELSVCLSTCFQNQSEHKWLKVFIWFQNDGFNNIYSKVFPVKQLSIEHEVWDCLTLFNCFMQITVLLL